MDKKWENSQQAHPLNGFAASGGDVEKEMIKMRLCLCVVMCLIVHSTFAAEFDVSDRSNFIVLKQKDGVNMLFTAAIRKSQISSVSLEEEGRKYRLVITTSMQISDSGTFVLKEHRTGTDKKETIESAFNQILELLAKE